MAVSGSFPGHLWAAFHGRLHPWTVVKSNDEKRARLEAIRHVLHTLPYPDKDERIVHRPDPQICGPANELAEYGEVSGGSFPRVR
ncbi:hypothetical protein M3D47_010365 [Micrococcus luteus]|nr:hypothetical protein [Micrococcus luteus]